MKIFLICAKMTKITKTSNWYYQIQDDLGKIPDFVEFHENELNEAKKDTILAGHLEKNIQDLPSITEKRYNQLQEVEAVLNFLHIEMKKIRRQKYIEYERYQKALTAREVEKYVDGEDDVIDMELLINEIALIRNKYLGVMKGLETKNYMSGYVTRLRVVGLEDVEI